MTLVLPNTIDNQTAADAVEVEQNFQTIVQYVNTNVITRDGAVAMDGPLLLAGAPTQDLQAATKAYVDALLPVGIIMPYAGAAVPPGKWLLCNGASVSTGTYPKLFAVTGYRYGGAGGSFNIPNLNGRFPVGLDSTQTRFNTTGKSGGTTTVPLPQHDHSIAHDHGQFNSGVNNVGHVHPMNHDHPSVASSETTVGADIAIPARANPTAFGSGSVARSNNSGTALNIETFTTGGSHAHNVNVPAYVGNTSDESADHVHPVNVPAYSGDSGNAGVANADMVQPYLVVNYIIRVD